MGRNRNAKNRGLPPNLYLRKGIYYYRDIRTKKEYSVGSNKSLAITEAIQANIEIYQPKISLIQRINNMEQETLHSWLDKYQVILSQRGLREKTIKDYANRIGLIKKHFANKPMNCITPKDIYSFINSYPKKTMAKLLRSILSDSFHEAIAAGIVTSNPVSVTKAPKVTVQRTRLTLEQFQYAVDHAPEKYRNVFLLALLTAQRISDIVKMKWSDIHNDRLLIEQSKTGTKIAIPVTLKLNAVDVTLSDVLKNLTNNSETICDISVAALRNRFSASLPEGENKPTFHEIRSLSARLYEDEKSAEFAKKILGHKSMQMTDKYLDDRGNGYTEL